MTLGQAKEKYAVSPPRGEYVLFIDGTPEDIACEDTQDAMAAAQALALRLIEEGLARTAAVKTAAAQCGVPKNALYDRIIEK